MDAYHDAINILDSFYITLVPRKENEMEDSNIPKIHKQFFFTLQHLAHFYSPKSSKTILVLGVQEYTITLNKLKC